MPITETISILVEGSKEYYSSVTVSPRQLSVQTSFPLRDKLQSSFSVFSYEPSLRSNQLLLVQDYSRSNSFNLIQDKAYQERVQSLQIFEVDVKNVGILNQYVGVLDPWVNPNKKIITLLQQQAYNKLIEDHTLIVEEPAHSIAKTECIVYSGGRTHTVSIYQEDVKGPQIFNLSPGSGSTFNNPLTDISFNIIDVEGSAIPAASINIYVNSMQVISGGVNISQPGFGDGILTVNTPSNYLFTFANHGIFDPNYPVLISGSCIDAAIPFNSSEFQYQFRVWDQGDLYASITALPDINPPILLNQNPAPNEIDVMANSNISFEVIDYATGLDLNSLEVYLNDVLVLSGTSTASQLFNVMTSGVYFNKGVHIDIDPVENLEFNSVYTITVKAKDLASPSPNTLQDSYSFITYDNSYLTISGLQVQVDGSYVDCDQGMSYPSSTSGTEFKVNFYNFDGTGLDLGLCSIAVNGTTIPSVLLPIDSYSYEAYFNLVPDYSSNSIITFNLVASGTVSGSSIYKQFSSTLLWGYEVCYDPEGPFKHGAHVPVVIKATDLGFHSKQKAIAYEFSTMVLKHSDLFAEITPIKPEEADMFATLLANTPFFEYGKEMTLEVQASDFSGNLLNYKWKFTIKGRD